MTPFRFEHTFRAPSVAAVFDAYFDRSHQIEQDRALDIQGREYLESTDTRRVCRVVPKRQLPSLIRPFVAGGKLSYVETVAWHRTDDRLEIVIQPSLLGGRAQIHATYHLARVGHRQIHRIYEGQVTVEIALVAGRIERGIVAEFGAGMPIAATVTQAWLDVRVSSALTPGNPSGILSA